MSTELLPALALLLVLGLAVFHDIAARRIPNKLILAGACAAFALHAFLPAGAGLFATPAGARGLGFALAGFGLGLVLLMPFYALRTMGAGDVKLMAVIGAFTGPAGVAGAVLLTMIAGGVLAIAVTLWSGQLAAVMLNLQQMLRGAAGMKLAPPSQATGKLPYAVAIGCGTLLQLSLAGHPSWRMFS